MPSLFHATTSPLLTGAAVLCLTEKDRASTSAWHGPEVAPELSYLRVSLDDVVLDPTLRAELLLAQQAAVLAHRVLPLVAVGQVSFQPRDAGVNGFTALWKQREEGLPRSLISVPSSILRPGACCANKATGPG